MKQSGLSHLMTPKHCLCRLFPPIQDSVKSSPPRWPFILVAQWTWRLLRSLTSLNVNLRWNIPSGHPSHFDSEVSVVRETGGGTSTGQYFTLPLLFRQIPTDFHRTLPFPTDPADSPSEVCRSPLDMAGFHC